MIQEAYCSFEVAKLLKENGFDEYCYMHYEKDGSQYISDCEVNNSQFDKEQGNCISAPTHQMALRWLRKVHRLHIYPDYIDFLEHGEVWVVKIIDMKTFKEYSLKDTESSFEYAVEEALKYTLENLI